MSDGAMEGSSLISCSVYLYVIRTEYGYIVCLYTETWDVDNTMQKLL